MGNTSSMLVTLTLVAACGGGSGDECEQFWNKTKPMMEKAAKENGKTIGDAEKAKFLEKCRAGRKEGKGNEEEKQMFDCVLKASGDAAVAACMAPAFGDYMKKAKKSEAQIHLNKLGKLAKVAYIENAEFPVGKTATSMASCCGQPNNKCAPNPSAFANDPVWSKLDFSIEEPSLFRYSYESDGKTFTAKAIGDLDCDATEITYTLTGSAPDGNPQSTLDEPAPSAD